MMLYDTSDIRLCFKESPVLLCTTLQTENSQIENCTAESRIIWENIIKVVSVIILRMEGYSLLQSHFVNLIAQFLHTENPLPTVVLLKLMNRGFMDLFTTTLAGSSF